MGQETTIGAKIAACAERLESAGLWFGHGTDNALDEAAVLVLSACDIAPDDPDPAVYQRGMSAAAYARLERYLEQRIRQRKPAAYIVGEAWFAGRRFIVDERVLIPRSPFAELIDERFEPWLRPGPVRRILEVGTGSGCIAIAAALAFPKAQVVATDVSAAALEVAAVNRQLHGLDDRLMLVRANLLAGLRGPFDLVLSNPPYVPESDSASLPAEYAHEPGLGLYSGRDGLDCARRILQDAASCMAGDGLLALEVGAGWADFERAVPTLPIIWPEFERGGEGIALLRAEDLRKS
jgi:ribosomal protein L3 glutamine methyltransferase